ncbi:BgTH12-01700 [Blumeria graminis f. sp. triticale]|uniref:BgTH12-01700 n=1 Tax=Blumeria graminis f. sp. triticale TaxID=1689686 RepID=A0A9W4CZJ4_BLUGR|nr:BgTH12-01700 [Blumeria graminis f. sp. triticale]
MILYAGCIVVESKETSRQFIVLATLYTGFLQCHRWSLLHLLAGFQLIEPKNQ